MTSLGPDEKYAESFAISKSLQFNGSSSHIGVVQVKWSASMGEHGYIRGEEISVPLSSTQIGIISTSSPSGKGQQKQNSSPETPIVSDQKAVLSVFCVECPETAVSGQDFQVKLRVYNNGISPLNLQLRCSNACKNLDGDVGVLIVGATIWNLGVLKPKQFADTFISVVPLTHGLHEIRGINIIDLISKKELCSNFTVSKILVYESSDERDDLVSLNEN